MAVFTPACFSPCSGAQLPTKCICRDTINVTFADCLLAFYLNGIQLWHAAGSLAAVVTHCVWGPPVYKVALFCAFLGTLDWETQE